MTYVEGIDTVTGIDEKVWDQLPCLCTAMEMPFAWSSVVGLILTVKWRSEGTSRLPGRSGRGGFPHLRLILSFWIAFLVALAFHAAFMPAGLNAAVFM